MTDRTDVFGGFFRLHRSHWSYQSHRSYAPSVWFYSDTSAMLFYQLGTYLEFHHSFNFFVALPHYIIYRINKGFFAFFSDSAVGFLAYRGL